MVQTIMEWNRKSPSLQSACKFFRNFQTSSISCIFQFNFLTMMENVGFKSVIITNVNLFRDFGLKLIIINYINEIYNIYKYH